MTTPTKANNRQLSSARNNIVTKLQQGIYHKFIIGAALKDFSAIEQYAYIFAQARADVIDISAFPHSVISALKGITRAIKHQSLSGKLSDRGNCDAISQDVSGIPQPEQILPVKSSPHRLASPEVVYPKFALANEDEHKAADETLQAGFRPLIMVSINLGQDPHFRRVQVDWDACTKCLACIPSCPSGAFTAKQNFDYNIDLCFGCDNCLSYCDFDALSFQNWNAFKPESLTELETLGAQAFEIHFGKELDRFEEFYKALPEHNMLESFSIGSKLMTIEDLQLATNKIIELTQAQGPKHVIIQSDGIPLSGAKQHNDKGKQSIANAKIIQEVINSSIYKEYVFVQLAGGITENTLAIAHTEGLRANGVAFGSYARAAIQEHLDLGDESLDLASSKAQKLINSSIENTKNLPKTIQNAKIGVKCD